MRIGFLIGGVALAVLAIAVVQWWPSEPEVVEVETETRSAPPPTPITNPAPDSAREVARPVVETIVALPPAPPLDESDEFVRETLADYTIPPVWLERDELIRRLAVVLDNAARGTYPRRQLGFMAPQGKFKVIEREGELYVDPANYQRFDPYLDLLESIGPEALVAVLDRFTPLLDEALVELGNPGSVAEQLREAVDQILAVPVLRDDLRLIQPKVFYEYAQPRLEGLQPLQKQVLRMGPDNTERLQRYLKTLRPLVAR